MNASRTMKRARAAEGRIENLSGCPKVNSRAFIVSAADNCVSPLR
jgi:hypothetical protein